MTKNKSAQKTQEVKQAKAKADSTSDLSVKLESILADGNVVQAFLVVLTEDNEYVRTKGHFYDNAALINSILSDFREKIYLDIFSGPKPPKS